MGDRADMALEHQRIFVGSSYFAELIDASQSTSQDEIDTLLDTLQAQKEAWVCLEIYIKLVNGKQ